MDIDKAARHRSLLALPIALAVFSPTTSAGLIVSDLFTGNVGLSIDAVGSNSSPVGNLSAEIPVGANILRAYLYTAGTPFPWYSNSLQTAADYNGAGITLNGQPITNYDTIVGAVSDRAAIGQWYTGRADVTSSVAAWHDAGPNYNWEYTEGPALNNRIDGSVLVVAYEEASLPESSVVILDGGQDTGGETTEVFFGAPLTGVGAPDFFADMSLGISFSVGSSQVSDIDVNGSRMSSSAGGFDDGVASDGGLITAGGIGDSNDNPAAPGSATSPDDELYSLIDFLTDGDSSFSVFTQNDSNDDNIFFMGLHIAAQVTSVNDDPTSGVPVPTPLMLVGLGLYLIHRRATAA